MSIAKKEHKKEYKNNINNKKNKVLPTWFNEKIESSDSSSDDTEFKNFIEEFRK